MSYSGKYPRFSHGQQGFDSLHRRQRAPTRRSPTRKNFWFDSRSGPHFWIRCQGGSFPLKEIKSIEAFSLGRAQIFLAVGAGAWSRLISADRMVRFHRLRLRHALIRRSPTRSERSLVGGVSKTRGFHTRALVHFCRCRTAASTSVSRTDDTGSIPVTDTKRIHSAKPYTQQVLVRLQPGESR